MVVGNDIIYRGNENKSASKLQAVVRRKIN
jgi:hypothetical protein